MSHASVVMVSCLTTGRELSTGVEKCCLCGGTVFTADPLMRKMSATFMAGSNVHELSKPLSYRGLCSYHATYMVRNFAFVTLVNTVHLPRPSRTSAEGANFT